MTASSSDNVSEEQGQSPKRTQPAQIASSLSPYICTAISIVGLFHTLDIFVHFDVFLFREQFFAVIYGLIFAGGFLTLKRRKSRPELGPTWLDILLATSGLVVGLYLAVRWGDIVRSAGILTTERVVISTIAIVLILELTRRAFGWSLVILSLLFMAYALFNFLIPGPFGGRGPSWPRLSRYVITDTSALLGLVSAVVFGMVFAFLLFGRGLFLTGGGAFFTDISMALMGNRRGGPAKVAVMASGLFGSLSGSASGNVVVTGSITIPMMINNGFRPAMAGAVEAVASSGGGLLPPIMGATAFIMAEFLEVPYQEIVVAATVPALLYFLVLFIQVDLESGRLGLKGVDKSELPSKFKTLLQGWTYLVPIAALIYCLFVIFLSPTKSALIALLCVVMVSYLGPNKATPRVILDILKDTGQAMVELGLVAAIAGMILGVINFTGIGLLFSQQILSIANGNLAILLGLTAVTSIILGMSMPVTASYIILAVLAAPALVTTGVSPIAAHLFVFYFAILSFLTPPVCVSVFVAATIAKSDPLETAWQSMKLAVGAYIVPFVFVVEPHLLLKGDPTLIAVSIGAAIFGLYLISIGLVGFAWNRVPTILRIAIIPVGLACFWPDLTIKLIAAGVSFLIIVVMKTRSSPERTS